MTSLQTLLSDGLTNAPLAMTRIATGQDSELDRMCIKHLQAKLLQRTGIKPSEAGTMKSAFLTSPMLTLSDFQPLPVIIPKWFGLKLAALDAEQSPTSLEGFLTTMWSVTMEKLGISLAQECTLEAQLVLLAQPEPPAPGKILVSALPD
jgi:hypothetical protein